MANAKKTFALALLSLSIGVGCSPIMHQVHRNGVKGAIIDRKVRFIYMANNPPEVRFNPTHAEIDKFERYMAADKDLDTLRWSPRQYAGYFDEKTGERCLFVILHGKWAAEHSPWRKEPTVIFDNFLWGVEFNLNTQKIKVFDL
jgi:hypothetical protein